MEYTFPVTSTANPKPRPADEYLGRGSRLVGSIDVRHFDNVVRDHKPARIVVAGAQPTRTARTGQRKVNRDAEIVVRNGRRQI